MLTDGGVFIAALIVTSGILAAAGATAIGAVAIAPTTTYVELALVLGCSLLVLAACLFVGGVRAGIALGKSRSKD
ncbi:MAG TPA: hypothetical protein VK116_01875 [Planctomycetota bacterium]|nr:hypothetical protein [Planctomycetota bacterium]